MRHFLLAAVTALAFAACADDTGTCPQVVSEPTMPGGGVVSEPTMPGGGLVSEPTMPGGGLTEPTMPGGGATVEDPAPGDDPCFVAQQPDDSDQIMEPCGPNGCGKPTNGGRVFIGGYISEPIGP